MTEETPRKTIRKVLPHTTVEQIQFILEFLEETPRAVQCLMGETGGRGATVQSGTPFSDKKMVYDGMAKTVNRKCKFTDKAMQWDDKTADNRWNNVYSKYTRAVAWSLKTGQGVDARVDGQAGVDDILERMCPCYARLDKLFGSRQSVRPHDTSAAGTGVEDGDDDDDIQSPQPVGEKRVSGTQQGAAKKKAKKSDDGDTSDSVDTDDMKKLNEKYTPNKSSGQKSNTSFASQYAKGEEARLAMLKEDLEFQKTVQSKRLEFEEKKYADEQRMEREKMKSAARIELIKAGLRGADLIEELKTQFPDD